MKWYDAIEILGIDRRQFFEIAREVFPDKRVQYSEDDIEIIKDKIFTNTSSTNVYDIKKVVVERKDIEMIGENEYYAKIIKGDVIWSVGSYTSTNLNEDLKRFEKIGMKLVIIDYNEANSIYHKLIKSTIQE